MVLNMQIYVVITLEKNVAELNLQWISLLQRRINTKYRFGIIAALHYFFKSKYPVTLYPTNKEKK